MLSSEFFEINSMESWDQVVGCLLPTCSDGQRRIITIPRRIDASGHCRFPMLESHRTKFCSSWQNHSHAIRVPVLVPVTTNRSPTIDDARYRWRILWVFFCDDSIPRASSAVSHPTHERAGLGNFGFSQMSRTNRKQNSQQTFLDVIQGNC